MLKPGGYLEFDDYGWSFAGSRWMHDTRQDFMTEEQIRTPQVKMVIDLFLRGNPAYQTLQTNRLFRKSGAARSRAGDEDAGRTERVTWRDQSFQLIRHPAVAAALREFRSPFEAGTLQFFDAVLPGCDRMIDVGAHVGLISLYVAGRVEQVFSFEPSPGNFALLTQNVAANDALQSRIRLFRCGLSDADGSSVLFRKAANNSGSSIFRTVERDGLVSGVPEATIALRDARDALGQIGVTGRTLLKIDIEGAEYLVLPRIAGLLAEARPFLHVSFHPFNLVSGAGEYLDTLVRLRRAMQVAEALADYGFMYCCTEGRWQCIEAADRMTFLREYLLRPKPLPRIGSAQYGFVDAIGFADRRLPGLESGK